MEWPQLPGLVARGREFARQLETAARKASVDPLDLATLIQLESAGTWSPTVRNPYSSATGFVQWMPSTWKALGMPDPATLTPAEQLAWIPPTFETSRGGRPPSARSGDTYLLIFYPAAAGAPDDTVIGAAGSRLAAQNPGMEGPDGSVTAGSVRAVFERLRAAHDALPRWDDGGGPLGELPPPPRADGTTKPSTERPSARLPVAGILAFVAAIGAVIATRKRPS